MPASVSIVDFGFGNLRSVLRKLELLGAAPVAAATSAEILAADRLILPGVGCFTNAIARVRRNGMHDALSETVLARQRPVLGICLGAQLMGDGSDEGDASGFGWIKARSIRFRPSDALRFKVPQIGWNKLKILKPGRLLAGIDPDAEYYFAHAYHFDSADGDWVSATSEYDYPFSAVIERGNIFGTQFHPEKSHGAGEAVLRNFLRV
ncbi:MAG: imidazole glycerol phosphate synthase subunit HisH [Sphingosinicella sp.]